MNAPYKSDSQSYQFALLRKPRGILTLALILPHQGRGRRKILFVCACSDLSLGSRVKFNRKISNIFSLAIFRGRFENGLGDCTISAAATDIPGEPFSDLLSCGSGIFHE